MGAILCGGNESAWKDQERRTDISLHKYKMELLDSLARKEKSRISRNDDRVKIIEKLGPAGRLYLQDKIGKEVSRWCCAPMEQAWANRAYDAFHSKDYCCGLIYRYLTEEDILSASNL